MKTTLITGGNSGIGAAIGDLLRARGERVVSLGLEKPTTENENLFGYTADLTDAAATAQVAAQIAAEVGRDETVLKPVAHSLAGDIGAMAAELSKTFGVPVSADGPALPEFRAVDDAAVAADALVLEAALARCVALCRRNRALSS